MAKERDARVAYGDIIDHPHHQSRVHPHMSLYMRAAQFAPFSALSGYDDMVREEARVTQKRRELSEEEKGRLDEKLGWLFGALGKGLFPVLTLTAFFPDAKKEGGSYRRITGRVLRINQGERTILIQPEEPDFVRDCKASETTNTANKPSRQVEGTFLEEPDFVRDCEAGEITKSASEPNRHVETVFLEEGKSLLSIAIDQLVELSSRELDALEEASFLAEPDFVRDCEAGEVTKSATEQSRHVESAFLKETSLLE